MKYENIDEVKPSAEYYMQAHILIVCDGNKDIALEVFGISEEDYDDNIEMILKFYDNWPGRSGIMDYHDIHNSRIQP